MYLRETKGKNKTYLSLVEGYREAGKVKQRRILSLGSLDKLNETTLISLSAKLLSHCKNHAWVDLKNAQETRRINWGLPAVIDQLWSLFSLDSCINPLKEDHQLQFDLAHCMKLMIMDRFYCPRSKRQTYQHQQDYFMPHKKPLQLQHLYRTLSYLSQYKDRIEAHIFNQNTALFGMPVEVVFFDVTTFYFESTKANDLKDFGYSKDAKFNEVQVMLSLLINAEGRPVGFDLFQGNTYEGHTLTQAILKMKDKYGIKKAIIVADRGINTGLNLHTIKAAGCHYIMGYRFRSASLALQNTVLDPAGYQPLTDPSHIDQVFKYKVINHQKQIKENRCVIDEIPERIICTWSSVRARKDRADRERLIEKAKSIVTLQDAGSPRGARKYVITQPASDLLSLDEAKIKADAQWDGFYAIETSDATLSASAVIGAYHELWQIEACFRVLKSHLRTRPVFHWTSPRIQGHFVLSYITFLFERTLEIALKKAGEAVISAQGIRDSLSRMALSEIAADPNHVYRLRAPLDDLGQQIVKVLGVLVPQQMEVIRVN